MQAIWNQTHLERPPNVTCYVKRQEFDTTTFLAILDKVIRELASQELLHKEAAILSRMIYRMKTKYRNDKGVKFMLKVNKALLNYLSLQLHKEYEHLKSYVEIQNDYVTLPSKQMLEYVLVRTQGFSKLMLRVEDVARLSAHFFKCRMSSGHSWIIAAIAYSIVSRIWLLSRYLVKQSCAWYNGLYRYLKVLKSSQVPWLPDNYELADDLKSWLSVPWINEAIPRVPSSYGLEKSIFKFIKTQENDSDDDITSNMQDNRRGNDIENDTLEVEEKIMTSTVIAKMESKIFDSNDDAGEAIDRRSFYSNSASNAPMVSEKRDHKKFGKFDKMEEKVFHRTINIRHNERKSISNDVNNKRTRPKKHKNSLNKLEKDIPDKLLTFDDVKNKSDAITLLDRESYPGVDKLQWKIIRNKGKKLVHKLDVHSNESKQPVVLKKVIKRIQSWII